MWFLAGKVHPFSWGGQVLFLFFFHLFFRVCITIATGGEAKLSKEAAPAEGQLSHTIWAAAAELRLRVTLCLFLSFFRYMYVRVYIYIFFFSLCWMQHRLSSTAKTVNREKLWCGTGVSDEIPRVPGKIWRLASYWDGVSRWGDALNVWTSCVDQRSVLNILRFIRKGSWARRKRKFLLYLPDVPDGRVPKSVGFISHGHPEQGEVLCKTKEEEKEEEMTVSLAAAKKVSSDAAVGSVFSELNGIFALKAERRTALTGFFGVEEMFAHWSQHRWWGFC